MIFQESLIEIGLASVGIGLVSGLLAGLFGIGGGMVIVPVLVFLFSAQGFPEHLILIMAIATSLATIFFTAIASVLAHHRMASVRWRKVFGLAPGIMIGAALGAVLADNMNADILKKLFISYLLYIGTHMALQSKPRSGQTPSTKMLDFTVSIFIGFTSSLVGIGGGTLTVPYLVHFQTPMRNAVAIASACGLPIALAGTLSYAYLGRHAVHLPEWSIGYIYLPAFTGILFSSLLTAPIGARLANKLPGQKLKRYFSLLIFAMAIKLLWD